MPPPRGSFNPIEGPGDYDVTKDVHSDTYAAIDPTQFDLSGKAVLVTGGSKGIGKAIALTFVRAGISYVAIGARNIESIKKDLEDEIESVAKSANRKAPQVLLLKLDITDVASVSEAASKTDAAFGRLDILVNNAGSVGSFATIVDSDPDQWWNIIDLTLRGPYLVCRAFIPLLLRSPEGMKTIANIASVGALVISPGLSHYQIGKLAVVRLTEFIAKEHADDGLIAFNVHPGNVMTDIFGPDGPRQDLKHIFVDTPRLAAETVVYLTGQRREWLTGRYINVTWDMPELEAKKEDIVRDDKLKVKLEF